MFLAPYIFLATLLVIVFLVLSIKFEWADFLIGTFIGMTIIGVIASLLTSVNQTKHVKYKKIDVEIAKTNRLVFVDSGDSYTTFETVHDLKSINDSTKFYLEYRVNVWGYTFIENPIYEFEK